MADLRPELEADFEAEKSIYKKRIAEKLQAEIELKSLGGRGWDDGVNSLTDFTESVVKRRLDLHPENMMDFLTALKNKIELDGDKYLYQTVVDAPDSTKPDKIRVYLDKAEPGMMKEHCKVMAEYLTKIKEPQGLTLVLESIHWGKAVDTADGNFVTVDSKKGGPFKSTPGDTVKLSTGNEFPLGRHSFTSSKTIHVSAMDDGTGVFNIEDDLGNCDFTKSFSQMTDEFSVELKDAKKAGTRLIFRLDGFPARPILPSFNSQSN